MSTTNDVGPHGEFVWDDGCYDDDTAVNVPTVGPSPALVFRFTDPTGNFYPPTVLVCDDDQMAKLRPLVNQAVHAAREAAKAQRGT